MGWNLHCKMCIFIYVLYTFTIVLSSVSFFSSCRNELHALAALITRKREFSIYFIVGYVKTLSGPSGAARTG